MSGVGACHIFRSIFVAWREDLFSVLRFNLKINTFEEVSGELSLGV